mgnify:CR=1 FL=1
MHLSVWCWILDSHVSEVTQSNCCAKDSSPRWLRKRLLSAWIELWLIVVRIGEPRHVILSSTTRTRFHSDNFHHTSICCQFAVSLQDVIGVGLQSVVSCYCFLNYWFSVDVCLKFIFKQSCCLFADYNVYVLNFVPLILIYEKSYRSALFASIGQTSLRAYMYACVSCLLESKSHFRRL